MRIIDQLVYKITGDSSGFDSAIDKSDKKVNTFSNTIKKLSAGLTIAGAAIIVKKAVSASVDSFSDLETSLKATSTLFGGVNVDMENLQDQTLALSSATGLASNEIGNALYSALSAGIPVTEDMTGAMDFMTKSAQLAKAGFTDIDTAVSTTAKTMNAYGLGLEDVDYINKVLIQTQNLGITTVNELGQSLAQVTPTASAFGVSFDQVGASLASMTAQGTPTAQATTQLNSLIAELGKQGTIASKNLANAAESAGLTDTSFSDLLSSGKNLGDILDLLDTYASDSNLSLVDMFSSIEAGKAGLALSGDNLEKFNDNLEQMTTDADVVGSAYNKVMDSWDEKNKLLKTSIENLGVSMAKSLLPSVGDVVGKVAGLVTGFNNLVTGTIDLKSATDEIIGISKDYNTILKKLNGTLSDQETLELSLAKIRDSASLQKAFDEFADGYQSVEKLKKAFTGVGGSITLAQENVDSFTQQLKAWAQDNQIEFDPDISFKDLYAKMDEAVPSQHLESLLQGYVENYSKLTNATSEYDAIVKKQTLSIGELSDAVANGSLNIDSLQFSNKELYDLISDGVSTRKKEIEQAEELAQKYSDLTDLTDSEKSALANLITIKLKSIESDTASATLKKLLNNLTAESTEVTEEATTSTNDLTEATKRSTKSTYDDIMAKDSAYKSLASYYQTDKEAFISATNEKASEFYKAGVSIDDIAKWISDQETQYAQEQADKEQEILDQKREAWIGYGKDVASSIGSTWGYINDIQENQNDKELTRLQGLVDATEEGTEARETAEQNLLDAKNEFAKEEAQRDKAQASFNAVIDTASAVIGLLANPGGLLGVGLSAGAIATGAAQLGAINSAEVPSYRVGTIDVPYDGLKQLHAGEGVMTKGIMDEAKTQGITIEPKNNSSSSSDSPTVIVYLGEEQIVPKIIKVMNKGKSGAISKRIVK